MFLKRKYYLVYYIFGISKDFYKYFRGSIVISKCKNLKVMVISEAKSLFFENKT